MIYILHSSCIAPHLFPAASRGEQSCCSKPDTGYCVEKGNCLSLYPNFDCRTQMPIHLSVYV